MPRPFLITSKSDYCLPRQDISGFSRTRVKKTDQDKYFLFQLKNTDVYLISPPKKKTYVVGTNQKYPVLIRSTHKICFCREIRNKDILLIQSYGKMYGRSWLPAPDSPLTRRHWFPCWCCKLWNALAPSAYMWGEKSLRVLAVAYCFPT